MRERTHSFDYSQMEQIIENEILNDSVTDETLETSSQGSSHGSVESDDHELDIGTQILARKRLRIFSQITTKRSVKENSGVTFSGFKV